MSAEHPRASIGRVVIYRLTDYDKQALIAQGSHNPNNGSDVAPAVIVRCWSDICVNLRVLIDGNETLWVTSAILGDEERQWQWPTRV